MNPSFLQPPICATEKSKSKANSTQRWVSFTYLTIYTNLSLFSFSLSCIQFFMNFFLPSSRANNGNGKDGWPTLSGHSKLANGLSEDRKSPPLLDYLDQEVLAADGLDTTDGPGHGSAISPFSSNCDSNRYRSSLR